MSNKCESCRPAVSRRSFMRFSLAGAGGVAASIYGSELFPQETKTGDDNPFHIKKRTGKGAKAMIFLWMGGGPTQYETFDPKPGAQNGGPTKAVETPVRGMYLAENLSALAKQGKHFSIIRSVMTMEGAHERGTSLMHTGMAPIPGQDFAPTGTIISYEHGKKEFPLPHFICIDPPLIPQCAHLGDEYLPFRIKSLEEPIPNLRSSVDRKRDQERAALLLEQSKEWDSKRQVREVRKIESAYVKSEEVMNTNLIKSFDYRSEPEAVKSLYQKGGRFGMNCLVARKLVENGVSFVEIGMGGWDTHNDNFNSVSRKCKELDPAMAALIKDLADRDMLKDVMVVWAGEFGRTPSINGGNGRDHYPNGFSVMVAGGLLQGGRVHGDTGPNGNSCAKPVPTANLFATIYSSMGLDPSKKYTINGRKVTYAYNGTPVRDLF